MGNSLWSSAPLFGLRIARLTIQSAIAFLPLEERLTADILVNIFLLAGAFVWHTSFAKGVLYSLFFQIHLNAMSICPSLLM